MEEFVVQIFFEVGLSDITVDDPRVNIGIGDDIFVWTVVVVACGSRIL
jgi:hypothetical protein